MKKTILSIICFLIIISPILVGATGAATEDIMTGAINQSNYLKEKAGLKYANPEVIITRSIQLILALLGVVFLILIIISGIEWMASGGETAKIDKAKGRIKNALIGLIIVLASFVITVFVFSNLHTIFPDSTEVEGGFEIPI